MQICFWNLESITFYNIRNPDLKKYSLYLQVAGTHQCGQLWNRPLQGLQDGLGEPSEGLLHGDLDAGVE